MILPAHEMGFLRYWVLISLEFSDLCKSKMNIRGLYEIWMRNKIYCLQTMLLGKMYREKKELLIYAKSGYITVEKRRKKHNWASMKWSTTYICFITVQTTVFNAIICSHRFWFNNLVYFIILWVPTRTLQYTNCFYTFPCKIYIEGLFNSLKCVTYDQRAN